MTDSAAAYQVTAEFYDLLQAAHYVKTAQRLLGRWLGSPQVGVIDAGAGTGLVTAMLARQCQVTVHAIEPAVGMRAILLSRLAGRPDELAKVRVHACGIERLGLAEAADFAWCFNTMASLDTAARAAALQALGTAMVRGATLVLQRPPQQAGTGRRDLPRWELGGDVYTGEVTSSPGEPGTVRWHFAYRVSRDGVPVREAHETFTGYLATEAELDRQLIDAGFRITGADDPSVVVARRLA